MNEETKKAVKQFCQAGGLSLLGEVIADLKKDLNAPRFSGNTDQLVYDTGFYNGHLEAFELLLENLTEIAQ